jgi:glutathione peroxidase-family protein
VALAVNVASKCGYTPQYGVNFLARGENRRQRRPSACPVRVVDLQGEWLSRRHGWNIEKFLIGRDGRVMNRYPSGTKPTDRTFLQDLADLL